MFVHLCEIFTKCPAGQIVKYKLNNKKKIYVKFENTKIYKSRTIGKNI